MSTIASVLAAISVFLSSLLGYVSSHGIPSDQQATTTASTTAVGVTASSTSSDGYISYNGQRIPGADPKTFALVTGPDDKTTDYGKDAAHVYYKTVVVQGADPATFTVVSGPNYDSAHQLYYFYAKDATHVFLDDLVIANADPATFVAIAGNSSYNAKDKNHFYLNGRALQ
jgi:hypothetical protein